MKYKLTYTKVFVLLSAPCLRASAAACVVKFKAKSKSRIRRVAVYYLHSPKVVKRVSNISFKAFSTSTSFISSSVVGGFGAAHKLIISN